ncbi:MAG: response regulator [Gammaproteobacteria bacterium]|nr:response regulator [Gammaproteobacteria bacterium]
MQHILLVDDDADIRLLLKEYLGNNGFRVTAVAEGNAMRDALRRETPVLILLDLNLPGEDGLSLARHIRSVSDTPIIMLTGKREPVDRVVGLEVGADDYIGKPFDLREVLARIKAVLRRGNTAGSANAPTPRPTHARFAGWDFFIDERQLISPQGESIKLTNIEFNLLVAFVTHPKRVLTRDQLLDLSRKDPTEVYDRSIDYSIMRLRRKVEPDPGAPALIRTEHGSGYIFTADVETE